MTNLLTVVVALVAGHLDIVPAGGTLWESVLLRRWGCFAGENTGDSLPQGEAGVGGTAHIRHRLLAARCGAVLPALERARVAASQLATARRLAANELVGR